MGVTSSQDAELPGPKLMSKPLHNPMQPTQGLTKGKEQHCILEGSNYASSYPEAPGTSQGQEIWVKEGV